MQVLEESPSVNTVDMSNKLAPQTLNGGPGILLLQSTKSELSVNDIAAAAPEPVGPCKDKAPGTRTPSDILDSQTGFFFNKMASQNNGPGIVLRKSTELDLAVTNKDIAAAAEPVINEKTGGSLTPPDIPPFKAGSISKRSFRHQRTRLSVASRSSRSSRRGRLENVDWSRNQIDFGAPESEPGNAVESPPAPLAAETPEAPILHLPWDNHRRRTRSAYTGATAKLIPSKAQNSPFDPPRSPQNVNSPHFRRATDYFSLIQPRAWTSAASDGTPLPSSPPPQAHQLRRRTSTSFRNSIIRRSGSTTPGSPLVVTGEEAILSNVFQGKLSPAAAETLLDDDSAEVVPVFTAVALYDFLPSSSDEDTQDEADVVHFRAGDRLAVYSKRNVRNTLLNGPDVLKWDYAKEVEVADGWCQVELENGTTGFAPVSYLQFPSNSLTPESAVEVELAVADPNLDAGGMLHEMTSPYGPKDMHHTFNPLLSTLGNDETPSSSSSSQQFRMVESFLNGLRDPSLTSINTDNLAYPSRISTLGNSTVLMASRVRKSLKRLLGSWFSGNSVQDFIVKGDENAHQHDTMGEENMFSEHHGLSARRLSVSTDAGTIHMPDKHYLQPGPTWTGNIPAFTVTLQAPQKRRKVSVAGNGPTSSTIIDEFVCHRVLTWFPDDVADTCSIHPILSPTYSAITVDRRFSDFEWLHDRLLLRFPPPVLALPPFPKKQLTKRFDKDHVEHRRRALETYLNHIATHPVLRSEEVVMVFLSCGGECVTELEREELEKAMEGLEGQMYDPDHEGIIVMEDEEWKAAMEAYDADHNSPTTTPGPASFYKRVNPLTPQPDPSHFPNAMDRFAAHLDCIDSHLDPLIQSMTSLGSAVEALPRGYHAAAIAMEELARGKADEGRLMRNLAWCWKQGCFECHELSSSMLSISKHLHGIANVHEEHAHQNVSLFTDRIRDYHALISNYQALSNLNDMAETRLEELIDQKPRVTGSTAHAQINGMQHRLTTVLSVAQAEVERLHVVKSEWRQWMRELLEGEIEAQEKVLHHLKSAREALI
ncbi:hypothetical protein DFS34DRAFT_402048 [Phlyctochytrium arcticum]|nr:hypothetical protein DFS34DRAFT_402048 [Phlyctochytrium arcticum]